MLTGVSSLLSLAPFLQHKCLCRAAVAGLLCRDVLWGQGAQPAVALGLPGLLLPEVSSCRVEKAPALGGSMQKGPPPGRAINKGLASHPLMHPEPGF